MLWYFWELILSFINFLASIVRRIGEFLLWIIVCGLPASVIFFLHCLVVCPKFFRQIVTKTKQDLKLRYSN